MAAIRTSNSLTQICCCRLPCRVRVRGFQTTARLPIADQEHYKSRLYPFYPSVEHLLHEKGISTDDVKRIPATGPNGRLLKGDVLAFVGKIEKSYAQEQSKRIEKLGVLDLSNIKLRSSSSSKSEASTDESGGQQQLETSKASQEAAPDQTAATLSEEAEVAIPVSLAAVLECQLRFEKTLGIQLPLATFIDRATELANEDLPRSRSHSNTPSADELFDSVIGVINTTAPKTSHGEYLPRISPLDQAMTVKKSNEVEEVDIIDFLTGQQPKQTSRTNSSLSDSFTHQLVDDDPVNLFSVTAKQGDEARAQAFLNRMKMTLESEPGLLIL